MMSDNLTIQLSKDEALVLFEFLSRFSDDKRLNIEHPAEEKILCDINCILESKLSEPLSEKYDVFLQRARESISELSQTNNEAK